MRQTVKLAVIGIFVTSLLGCSQEFIFKSTEDLKEEAKLARVARTKFSCNLSESMESTPMVRMTREQYENTIRDLLRTRFSFSFTVDTVMQAVAQAISEIPDDLAEGEDFRAQDERMSQTHVNSYYKVADILTEVISADADMKAAFFGSCSTDADDTNDAACVSTFIQEFGLRVFRRPLRATEQAFYESVYRPTSSLKFEEVARALLMAPQFIYLVEDENEATPGDADLFQLSGYEVATRLSYHFWRTMPDSDLLTAAAAGLLDTKDGILREAERLLADPRAKTTISHFFEEWLDLDETPDLGNPNSGDAYQAFLDGIVPESDLRERAIEESLELVRYSMETNGTLSDVFQSNLSFAQGADLASIYGVSEWNGSYHESDLVRLPAGERAGILTRVAFVSTDSTRSRPIIKGVRIKMRVLCDNILPPPADTGTPPPAAASLGTRARVELITEQEGSSCYACHAGINPLGFPLEEYDPIGRYRTLEKVFAEDGTFITQLIDNTSVPRVHRDDKAVVSGGVELSKKIVESGKLHACFARHYLRFSLRRHENLVKDGCSLEKIRSQAIKGKSLRSILAEIAVSREFTMRKK